MFTGIVSDIGRVRAIERRGDTRLAIETAYDTGTIAMGASIACAGVCLTVVETAPDSFVVEASAETMARTTAGSWRAGTRINLERALALGDELGGHLVTGHIDGVAVLEGAEPEGDSLRLTVRCPSELSRFVASKGSVALDGVSLTVNDVAADRFAVNLIPHTLAETTFGELSAGRAVNVEIDMLARYVWRALDLAPPGERA